VGRIIKYGNTIANTARLKDLESLDFTLADTTNQAEDFRDVVDELNIDTEEVEGCEDELEEGDENMDDNEHDDEPASYAFVTINLDGTNEEDEDVEVSSFDKRWPDRIRAFMDLLLELKPEKASTFCSICAADPWVPED
jgi:hypothetical protein